MAGLPTEPFPRPQVSGAVRRLGAAATGFRSCPCSPQDVKHPSMTARETRRLRLSRNRTLVGDVAEFARRMPTFAVDRLASVGELAALRSRTTPRISWTVLFLKAYALVAADCRPLRQAYLCWPWPHLIEHPNSVATVAINRRDEEHDEDRLCWGRFIEPERQSLVELQQALERYQCEPIDEVFRQQVQQSKLPRLLRRLAWWFNLNLVVAKRTKRLGTFSMSTLAGLGAWNRSHPSILTTSLTFGPLDEQGRMLLTLICDHRVLDGALAARVLADLEAALCGPVAQELAALATKRTAA